MAPPLPTLSQSYPSQANDQGPKKSNRTSHISYQSPSSMSQICLPNTDISFQPVSPPNVSHPQSKLFIPDLRTPNIQPSTPASRTGAPLKLDPINRPLVYSTPLPHVIPFPNTITQTSPHPFIPLATSSTPPSPSIT